MSRASAASYVHNKWTNLVVRHISRRPFPGSHSIEALFAELRDGMLQCGLDVDHRVVPFFSKGLLPRIGNLIWTCQLRRQVKQINHVTGDIHYIVMALPRECTVLTIHDLEMLDRLRGMSRWLVKVFWFDLPLRRATAITVISEATKVDLMRMIGISSERIRVIPNCVGEHFIYTPKVFSRSPVVLQVGTKANKNLSRLAAALEGLDVELHVVGRLCAQQREALVSHGVSYRESLNLTNAEMFAAYCHADIVALVSTKEGFGLPIVEAQSVGRPVITSNCSSMPEVAGEGACLVDPTDVLSIRSGIERIISDAEYRARIVAAGHVNSQRFARGRVVEAYASLYRDILLSSQNTRKLNPD